MPKLRFSPPQRKKGSFLTLWPSGLTQLLISVPSVLPFIKPIPRAASSPSSATVALQPFPLSTLVFSCQHKHPGLRFPFLCPAEGNSAQKPKWRFLRLSMCWDFFFLLRDVPEWGQLRSFSPASPKAEGTSGVGKQANEKKKNHPQTQIFPFLGCLENSDLLGGWREVKHPPGSGVR